MNDKVSQAVKLYDRLLEEQLAHRTAYSSQPAPSRAQTSSTVELHQLILWPSVFSICTGRVVCLVCSAGPVRV